MTIRATFEKNERRSIQIDAPSPVREFGMDRHHRHPNALALSPDGLTAASAGAAGGRARLSDHGLRY